MVSSDESVDEEEEEEPDEELELDEEEDRLLSSSSSSEVPMSSSPVFARRSSKTPRPRSWYVGTIMNAIINQFHRYSLREDTHHSNIPSFFPIQMLYVDTAGIVLGLLHEQSVRGLERRQKRFYTGQN